MAEEVKKVSDNADKFAVITGGVKENTITIAKEGNATSILNGWQGPMGTVR